MRPCARWIRTSTLVWCLAAALGAAAAAHGPAAPPSADAQPTAAAPATPGTAIQRADNPAAGTAGEIPALDERAALRAGDAVIGSTPADFAFTDRQGRPLRLSAYRGKPLLVSFIYTGCFQICPTQTRALHEAVKGLDKLLGPEQFNVISVGFNQPFDGPSEMRAFAAQQRIDYRNWEFVSPGAAAVPALTRAFGFSYVATPAGFDHVLGVTVLDAQGRIHAQVYGDRLRADQLGVPLRQLVLNAPVVGDSASATLAAVVERVRILCTVYDPETGTYRYDYKLIWMTIGSGLFFLTAFVYLLLEWRTQRRTKQTPPQRLRRLPPGGAASGPAEPDPRRPLGLS